MKNNINEEYFCFDKCFRKLRKTIVIHFENFFQQVEESKILLCKNRKYLNQTVNTNTLHQQKEGHLSRIENESSKSMQICDNIVFDQDDKAEKNGKEEIKIQDDKHPIQETVEKPINFLLKEDYLKNKDASLFFNYIKVKNYFLSSFFMTISSRAI